MTDSRVWINQRQPQTLVIATVLLYMNAFFLVLDVLRYGTAGTVAKAFLVMAVLNVAGGFGVANERRIGYWLALAAALAPFAFRIWRGAPLVHDLFGFAVEVALVALLLHPESRKHQEIWFK